MASGAEFREAMASGPAYLVILDVMPPDEDGLSLCRWVRGHQRLAQLPIIMLTASSDEADRVIGLELGADDYLAKPLSPRELLTRIKALLRRVQFSQERTRDVLAFEMKNKERRAVNAMAAIRLTVLGKKRKKK